MNKMIGMNPEEVVAKAATAHSQIGVLNSVTTSINKARMASLNPLSYGLTPGSFIVAPWALVGTTVAIAKVREAQTNADALLRRLGLEVDEQLDASEEKLSPGSRIPSWMRENSDEPDDDADTPWWVILESVFAIPKKVMSVVGALPKIYSVLWMAKYARDIRTLGALKGAWAWASAQRFPAAVTAFLESPAMKIVSKGFAVVGSVVSVAVAVNTWMDPNSTAWDKTRDTVTAGLAVTGTVLLFTPAAPVGAVILAVSGVWALGTTIWDNREAIGDWIGDVSSNVANFTKDAASNVANTAKDVAKSVTKTADNVINAGKDFISGIGKGLSFGW